MNPKHPVYIISKGRWDSRHTSKALEKMNMPYSFSNEQMNGIVEDTYANIIKECENLKKNTNCPNEQVLALLSVIASNFSTTTDKNNI